MRTLIFVVVCLMAVPAVAQESPFGPGWGAGMGFTPNLKGDVIQPGDAIVDTDGRVRVLKTSNTVPRVVVESHYTFRMPGLGGQVGVGPAMFIQAAGGTGQGLFDAAGGGLIFELGPEGNTSFNLLVGVLVDFAVSRMHSDYIDGRRSPTADILYVEGSEVDLFFGFVIGIK